MQESLITKRALDIDEKLMILTFLASRGLGGFARKALYEKAFMKSLGNIFASVPEDISPPAFVENMLRQPFYFSLMENFGRDYLSYTTSSFGREVSAMRFLDYKHAKNAIWAHLLSNKTLGLVFSAIKMGIKRHP